MIAPSRVSGDIWNHGGQQQGWIWFQRLFFFYLAMYAKTAGINLLRMAGLYCNKDRRPTLWGKLYFALPLLYLLLEKATFACYGYAFFLSILCFLDG